MRDVSCGPTVCKPKTESRASSRAITLRSGDLLESRTALQSADNESDLTRARTRVRGRQSRTAVRRARASQAVLVLDEPTLALNFRKSFFMSGVANHDTSFKLSNRTPSNPPRYASVAMQSPSKAHDTVSGKTDKLTMDCYNQSATLQRRQWTSSNGKRELEANAAKTTSTKGWRGRNMPATNSLPQNDLRAILRATLVDKNWDV